MGDICARMAATIFASFACISKCKFASLAQLTFNSSTKIIASYSRGFCHPLARDGLRTTRAPAQKGRRLHKNHCRFRKFDPAWIRVVRQNHRILQAGARSVSQPPAPGSGPLPMMVGHKHHYAGCKSATAQTGQIQPLWLFNLALEDASPDQIHRRARSCSAFSAAYMAP
jgi:hypothetical protein